MKFSEYFTKNTFNHSTMLATPIISNDISFNVKHVSQTAEIKLFLTGVVYSHSLLKTWTETACMSRIHRKCMQAYSEGPFSEMHACKLVFTMNPAHILDLILASMRTYPKCEQTN